MVNIGIHNYISLHIDNLEIVLCHAMHAKLCWHSSRNSAGPVWPAYAWFGSYSHYKIEPNCAGPDYKC